MAKFTQEKRHIKITTPLGPDKLLLSGMQGSEGISRLFSFDLSLFSEDQKISFADIIGKGVTVSIGLPSGDLRHFNGIISSFSQVSGEGTSSDDTTRVSQYRATLVPKFWLLTRSAELRIFQNMTVPEIVEKVLKQYDVTDFELKLQGSYDKREYCVQYRETHFNFISRLLEEEGIFYFFEHKADAHRLIIADSPQANAPCPGQKTASYHIQGSTPEDDTITSLEKMQSILPGKYMLSDFNFETPNNSLNVNIPGKYKLGPGDREIYDFPGGYMTKSPGDKLVRVRMEEEEAQITTVRGGGRCRSFTAGYRFTLINADRNDLNNKEFILTAIAHTISHSVQEGGAFHYGNRFSCIPADVPFRPPRITPKPVVQGSQTAIVVGPSGEEIYTDKYGRVKVQFHWDREGKRDENSSCWIRVGQLWAGLNWGAMYIPRIGQEVIVDFLEGDPDDPIITGRVYNAHQTPPYELPGNATQSGVKSRSSKGGSADNYNEIRFEDKKGSEQIQVHAERNMDTTIEADETRDVGGNRKVHVKGHFTENIDSGETRKVDAGFEETINGGAKQTINGGETRLVNGGLGETINGGEKRTIAGGVTESITGGETRTVTGGLTETITGALSQTVTGGITITSPAGVTINAPAGFTVVAPGGTRTVDSFFTSIGGKDEDLFAIQTAILSIQTTISGISTQIQGVKIDTTGVTFEAIGFKSANNPLTVETLPTKIKSGAIGMYMYGITLIS
jgi:type VI secretion system secreted protein VgrG